MSGRLRQLRRSTIKTWPNTRKRPNTRGTHNTCRTSRPSMPPIHKVRTYSFQMFPTCWEGPIRLLKILDKDVSKRVRLSDPSVVEANGASNPSLQIGRTGSIGDHTGEPPARRQRIGSTVSNGESYHATSVRSASQHTPGDESNITSPVASYFERRREQSPSFAVSPRDNSAQPTSHILRRDPIYVDGIRGEQVAPSRQLPPLSDVIDGRPLPCATLLASETPTPTFGLLPRGHQTSSPAPTPPSVASSETRPPSLRKEQSSAGSMSSGSSYSSYPRTPIEGPLPIHALLTTNGKQFGPYDSAYGLNPAIHRSLSPDDRGTPTHYPLDRAPSDPTTAGHQLPPVNGKLNFPPTEFYSYYKTNAYGPGLYAHASLPNITANAPPVRPAYPFGYGETTPTLAPVSATAHSPATSAYATNPGLTPRPGVKPEGGLDGISALLQADKIVDRHLG